MKKANTTRLSTLLHPWPASSSRKDTSCNSAESGFLWPSSPTQPPHQEDAISWDSTTLANDSHSDSDHTSVDSDVSCDTSPSSSPQSTCRSDAHFIDPATIPLPNFHDEPERLEEPEPTSFDGMGLVSSTSRDDALALRARCVGKCAKRRLGMRVLAQLEREREEREKAEKEERSKERKDRAKDGEEEKDAEEEEEHTVDSVVGDHEWHAKSEVKLFGIVRPVGISKK